MIHAYKARLQVSSHTHTLFLGAGRRKLFDDTVSY